MHLMYKRYGFSLIELMVVVSIIAILSAIAIPSYQGYIRRARFTEIILAVQPYKTAVALALQEGFALEELTTGKHDIPLPPKSSANLASISIENGVITATASALLGNATYILKPNTEGTIWAVSGTCLKGKLCNE